MLVRAAGIGDLERIAALFGQLGYPNDPSRLAACLADAAADQRMRVLVADDGGAVPGVAVVHVLTPRHVPQRWALLSALVVDDARRADARGRRLGGRERLRAARAVQQRSAHPRPPVLRTPGLPRKARPFCEGIGKISHLQPPSLP